MNRPHARDGWPQTTTKDNMIQSVKRHTTLKKPGERWQLDGTQLVVLDVRNDCVTLGLPAEAAVLHRPTRRSPRSRFSGASARSGYFWYPQGGPCLFVVHVRANEPIALSVGYCVVAEAISHDGVQLSYSDSCTAEVN